QVAVEVVDDFNSCPRLCEKYGETAGEGFDIGRVIRYPGEDLFEEPRLAANVRETRLGNWELHHTAHFITTDRMEPDFKRLLFLVTGRIRDLESEIRFLRLQIPSKDLEIAQLRSQIVEMEGFLDGFRTRLGLAEERIDNLESGGSPPDNPAP